MQNMDSFRKIRRPSVMEVARHSASRGRLLLLQGPVGPFFDELSCAAKASGYEVLRYTFNPADRLFAGTDAHSFRGDIADWEREFPKVVSDFAPDVVVIFGSSRPAHMIARNICAARGVAVLSLEEGYLRPGFVTAEWGGNNADSPLAGRLPPCPVPGPEAKGRSFRGLGPMSRHGALHYALRSIASNKQERSFFHRDIDILHEAMGWTRNAWKSLLHSSADRRLCEKLTSDCAERYFLIPLQVPTDANLQGAACGWTVRRLVDTALASFAASAPKTHRLVFKVHPMARGHGRMARNIRSVAAGNGIADRVDILETGALGGLARSCAGMITINSTSGLAAIAYGRPLLVVGRAVYSHPELATCADGNPDFEAFWAGGHVAPEDVRRSYLSWIAREALLPGCFYAARGRSLAARAILEKISVATQSGLSIPEQI